MQHFFCFAVLFWKPTLFRFQATWLLLSPILSSFLHWLLPPVPHDMLSSASLSWIMSENSECLLHFLFLKKWFFGLHRHVAIFPVQVIFICCWKLKNVLIWPLFCENRALSLKSKSVLGRFCAIFLCLMRRHIPHSWPRFLITCYLSFIACFQTHRNTLWGHHVIRAHSTACDIWLGGKILFFPAGLPLVKRWGSE